MAKKYSRFDKWIYGFFGASKRNQYIFVPLQALTIWGMLTGLQCIFHFESDWGDRLSFSIPFIVVSLPCLLWWDRRVTPKEFANWNIDKNGKERNG